MFPGNKPHCPVCSGHFSFSHKTDTNGVHIPCGPSVKEEKKPADKPVRPTFDLAM